MIIVLSVCKQYPVTYEAFIRGCAYAAKEYIDNPVKYGATENAIQYVRSTRILKRILYNSLMSIEVNLIVWMLSLMMTF